MRRLTKIPIPNVLAINQVPWTEAFLAQPDNDTFRFRYRHPEIKTALRQETNNKCVYCESIVGHNTPGNAEHKSPSSLFPDQHFIWENITMACDECNRRKGDYYDVALPFLDPYMDDVENRVVHHGPLVGWLMDDEQTEVTVRILEMHDGSRAQLLERKVEKLVDVGDLVGRINGPASPVMKALLYKRLLDMQDISAEYSAMVIAYCQKARVKAPVQ